MTVFVLQNAEPDFRGLLTRWMLEPEPGVLVGKIPARVRDALWEVICKQESPALCIYSSNTPQGYVIKMHRIPDRRAQDFDGITLITRKRRKPKAPPSENV
jgi:CRISPR-associated protein Cas2